MTEQEMEFRVEKDSIGTNSRLKNVYYESSYRVQQRISILQD